MSAPENLIEEVQKCRGWHGLSEQQREAVVRAMRERAQAGNYTNERALPAVPRSDSSCMMDVDDGSPEDLVNR